jgi:hypothetical protein
VEIQEKHVPLRERNITLRKESKLRKEFFMKNNKILLAILAIALVFGMTACSDGGGGSAPPPPPPPGKTSMSYQSKDSGGTLTLTPAGTNAPFNVTASGENMTAISGTITFTSGETMTKNESLTAVPVNVDKTFTLAVTRWDDGESWLGSIRLEDITPLKSKKGDELQFRISGTPDKKLEKFGISLQSYTPDWSDYQWLGGVGDENLPAAALFSRTFSVIVGDDPKNGLIVSVVLSCGTKTPANIPDGTIMATINDFEIKLVGIRNERDELKAFVDNLNKMPDAVF